MRSSAFLMFVAALALPAIPAIAAKRTRVIYPFAGAKTGVYGRSYRGTYGKTTQRGANRPGKGRSGGYAAGMTTGGKSQGAGKGLALARSLLGDMCAAPDGHGTVAHVAMALLAGFGPGLRQQRERSHACGLATNGHCALSTLV